MVSGPEDIEQVAGCIDRLAAAHAIELALSAAREPVAVLDLAHFHFIQMLGGDAAWPDRSALH